MVLVITPPDVRAVRSRFESTLPLSSLFNNIKDAVLTSRAYLVSHQAPLSVFSHSLLLNSTTRRGICPIIILLSFELPSSLSHHARPTQPLHFQRLAVPGSGCATHQTLIQGRTGQEPELQGTQWAQGAVEGVSEIQNASSTTPT